jgi:hypothetical protein
LLIFRVTPTIWEGHRLMLAVAIRCRNQEL